MKEEAELSATHADYEALKKAMADLRSKHCGDHDDNASSGGVYVSMRHEVSSARACSCNR
jgi:hypothetical protein